MGLVVSLAEALNIGWGLNASDGATTLRERLEHLGIETERQSNATHRVTETEAEARRLEAGTDTRGIPHRVLR
jgi:hypothetical protein